MGQKYLIDTNTVIDAQMNRLPEKGMQFIKNIICGYEFETRTSPVDGVLLVFAILAVLGSSSHKRYAFTPLQPF